MSMQPYDDGFTNRIIEGDCIAELGNLPTGAARLVVADPPYFQVLTGETWDQQWASADEYVVWSMRWIDAAMRLLMPGGLLYCFGQPGKREHVFLHLMAEATKRWEFHDLIVWDRVVGYNLRGDSFTPAYEMALVLRQTGAEAYFDRDAVREPYDEATIAEYARDKRYKNLAERMASLRRGKQLTNLWRIPSLKGTSKEKVGHPSQKPVALIERIILSNSAPGDWIVDPFIGSGTTGAVAQKHGRRWTGVEISPEYAALARTRIQNEESLFGLTTSETLPNAPTVAK